MLLQQSGRSASACSRGLLDRVSSLPVCVLAWVLAFVLLPSAAYSQTASDVDSNPKVQQRLQEVEAMKQELLRKMQDLDNRMHTLEEAEVKRQKSENGENRCQAGNPSAADVAAAADGCGRESTSESGHSTSR